MPPHGIEQRGASGPSSQRRGVAGFGQGSIPNRQLRPLEVTRSQGRRLGERDGVAIWIGNLPVADAVRVGLDWFVLDPLGNETLEERIEPSDAGSDAAGARLRPVRLNEQPGGSSIFQRFSFPTRRSGGRPKNRVYQSIHAPRSDTWTPAKRWVIVLTLQTLTAALRETHRSTAGATQHCRVAQEPGT